MPTVTGPIYAKPPVAHPEPPVVASGGVVMPVASVTPAPTAVPPAPIPPDVTVSLDNDVIRLTAIMRSQADVANVLATLTALGNLMKDD